MWDCLRISLKTSFSSELMWRELLNFFWAWRDRTPSSSPSWMESFIRPIDHHRNKHTHTITIMSNCIINSKWPSLIEMSQYTTQPLSIWSYTNLLRGVWQALMRCQRQMYTSVPEQNGSTAWSITSLHYDSSVKTHLRCLWRGDERRGGAGDVSSAVRTHLGGREAQGWQSWPLVPFLSPVHEGRRRWVR